MHKPLQERAGSVIELDPGKYMSDIYTAKYIPSYQRLVINLYRNVTQLSKGLKDNFAFLFKRRKRLHSADVRTFIVTEFGL